MSTIPADPSLKAGPFLSSSLAVSFPQSDFGRRATDYRKRVEGILDQCLPSPKQPPATLHEAMRYAVLGGGKRIRPLLVYATGEALGIPPAKLDAAAAAIELVHAFSLVHDDLPAMDDDDLRRGRPTTHTVYGEATAILVGDALQILAFDVIGRNSELAWRPDVKVAMISVLARAAGSLGMTGGQALDLAAEGQTLKASELEWMYYLKTGNLIQASVQMAAAAAAGLSRGERAALEGFGQRAGLAFQIWDDVLDVTGTTETIGKQAGADAARNKATWPALFGLDAARKRARKLYDEAVGSLAPLGDRAEPLIWLSNYIIDREH